MKKTLALVLTLLMIAAMAAACAPAPAAPTPAPATAAPAAPATAAPAGTSAAATAAPATAAAAATAQPASKFAAYEPKPGVKYTIKWLGLTNAPVKPDGLLVKHWEEKFNVDLDIMAFDQSTFNEQLNLALSTGQIPDMIGAGDFMNLARQGVLAELNRDVLWAFMPNALTQLEKEIPNATSYGVVDGKQYGFPRTVFMYNELRKPLVYNGLWLDKLGLKVPTTLAEYEDAMYKFTNDDPDGNGKKDTYGMSNTSLGFVYGTTGYDRGVWVDRDGKAVYGGVQPELKDALTSLAKWYKDGVLDPEFITGENTGGYWAISHAFVNERIGVSAMGSFYHWSPPLPGRVEGNDRVEIGKRKPEMVDKLIFGPAYTGPSGKSGVGASSVATNAYASFGKQLEKEPDKMGKIFQMFEFLYGSFNEESYITYMHGIKGVMWDYAPDGSVKQIGKYVDTKEIQSEGGWGIMHQITTARNAKLVEGKLMDWGYAQGLDKGIIRNIIPGFITFDANGKYKAELDKIENEAYIAIITGEKPVDYFDTFVKEWRAAGGDQLEKEVNDWYATTKK